MFAYILSSLHETASTANSTSSRAQNAKQSSNSKSYKLSPELLSRSGLKQPIEVPELDYMLAPGKVREYKFTKTDPFFILHTSGSTGLPKPIVLTHGWVTCLDAQNNLPKIDNRPGTFTMLKGKRIFCSLPPFHADGVALAMLPPLTMDSSIVWGHSDRPVSTVLIEEVLEVTHLDILCAAPPILEEMTVFFLHRKKNCQSCPPLDSVVALCPVSRRYPMQQGYSPEYTRSDGGGLPDPEDREYFNYPEVFKGIEFRDQGDGTYEQVIVRHASTDRLSLDFLVELMNYIPPHAHFPSVVRKFCNRILLRGLRT
jgi:hypothetical protein